MLTAARSRRSALSSQASELQQLQAELEAEVELDRQEAALSISQRIVRRLQKRQLGWKMLAVLLALAATFTSLQLLALKRQRSDDVEKVDAGLALLRQGVERSERDASALTARLLDYLAQARAALLVSGRADSADVRWVDALRERLQAVDSQAVHSVEEVTLRQHAAELEQRLAASSARPS